MPEDSHRLAAPRGCAASTHALPADARQLGRISRCGRPWIRGYDRRSSRLRRWNRTRAIDDQPVVLGPAVGGEVEHGCFKRPAERETAASRDQLVAERRRHRDRLARRRDDLALPDQITAFFAPGLGDRHHPRAVLICAGLHDETIVEIVSSCRPAHIRTARSEEHTSELQSQSNLVCRLLLEKKKKTQNKDINIYKLLVYR